MDLTAWLDPRHLRHVNVGGLHCDPDRSWRAHYAAEGFVLSPDFLALFRVHFGVRYSTPGRGNHLLVPDLPCLGNLQDVYRRSILCDSRRVD